MMPEAMHGLGKRATVTSSTLLSRVILAGGVPMRRPALYSRSPRAPQPADEMPAAEAASPTGTPAGAAPSSAKWQPGRRSFALLVLVFSGALGGALFYAQRHAQPALTQKDIDAAVLRTLETNSLPSAAARAADIIRPSVVRVVGYGTEKATPEA
ncbi:MAG: hypothetical protein EOO24_27330, partial [Comamonadaceae bacterium]